MIKPQIDFRNIIIILVGFWWVHFGSMYRDKELLVWFGLSILSTVWIFTLVWVSVVASSMWLVMCKAKHLLIPFITTAHFFIWPYICVSFVLLLLLCVVCTKGSNSVWRHLLYALLIVLTVILFVGQFNKIDHMEAINCMGECSEHITNMCLVTDLKHKMDKPYCLYLPYNIHTHNVRTRCFAHDPSLVQVFNYSRHYNIILLVMLQAIIWLISLVTTTPEETPVFDKHSTGTIPPPSYHSALHPLWWSKSYHTCHSY